MLTKLAVTSMAKWYDIPSVVIRSVQLNMCPICCKLVTINFMAQIGILPSCSFPVFQPIATSTTFFQIMNSMAKTEHFHPLERFNPFTFEPNIGLKLA